MMKLYDDNEIFSLNRKRSALSLNDKNSHSDYDNSEVSTHMRRMGPPNFAHSFNKKRSEESFDEKNSQNSLHHSKASTQKTKIKQSEEKSRRESIISVNSFKTEKQRETFHQIFLEAIDEIVSSGPGNFDIFKFFQGQFRRNPVIDTVTFNPFIVDVLLPFVKNAVNIKKELQQ